MPSTEIVGQDFSTRTAIVVDDMPLERISGKTMLEDLGFVVLTANNSEQALQLIHEQRIDLVLCDISMPGMSGIELLETTRNYAQKPIFVMATAFDDAEHAIASLRKGAFGYLTKPISFESLRSAIFDAFARHLEEHYASHQDSITNLMNKDEFTRRLKDHLKSSTPGIESGVVLLVKVHGLSHINHSYGRTEGDKVLKFTASTLSSFIRPSDMLARFSGDMFAIYLQHVAHSSAEERAVSLSSSAEAIKTVIGENAFSLTLIIGGACAYMGMEIDDLFNRADFVLHLARDRSRSRIRIYSEADEVHKRDLSYQLKTLTLVRSILNDPQRLHMYYQPIMNLETGNISHFEALLRLIDGQGQPCDTGELVKTCEVFGLIGLLDRTVVNACLDHLYLLPEATGVAINLSGKSIGDPDLLEFIEKRIAELNIDPSRIIFELTETAAFVNLDEVQHFMRRIKNLGCQFALDDFGVGFSSFYYIKQLNFDYLKIDGSFIAKLANNPNDQVFVRAMVEISRVFGLTVIAEWVEDKETADMLRSYGVRFGQGYYFGKPLPMPDQE